MMPLKGKEVSQCQLVGCTLILASSPSGLHLHWVTIGGDSQQTKKLGTAVLSNVQCAGKLYPVYMDSAAERAVFSRVVSDGNSGPTLKAPTAALVVCDSGTVMTAHWQLPGLCVTLCRMVQPVLWTGMLEVIGTSCIVVISRGGVISLGSCECSSHHSSALKRQSGTSSLVWQTRTLPTTVIASCGHKDMVLLSDGTLCWLCHLSFSKEGQLKLKCSKLYIYGIINIVEESENVIQMLSCDGRKYKCTWNTFIADKEGESWKKNSMVANKELPHTISGMMRVIEKCSQLTDTEGKTLQTLDLYLKQFSLAKRMLTDMAPVFLPSVTVEKKVEEKNSYVAVVHFGKPRADIDLRGRWWTLCSVVNEPNKKSVLSTKLDDECLRSSMCQTIVLPPYDFCNISGSIVVKSYLLLEHYAAAHPVCKIFACQFEVDILNFLTFERKLNDVASSSQHSGVSIKRFANANTFSTAKTSISKNPLPFCKVSVSFMRNDRIIALCKLLNITKFANTEGNETKTHQATLWYLDIRIDVSCSEEGNIISVKLEGPNPCLVFSLKAALQRRFLEHGQVPQMVSLSQTVVREAHFTHKLLNYEGNKASTVATISHLHQATTRLLSLIPLG